METSFGEAPPCKNTEGIYFFGKEEDMLIQRRWVPKPGSKDTGIVFVFNHTKSTYRILCYSPKGNIRAEAVPGEDGELVAFIEYGEEKTLVVDPIIIKDSVRKGLLNPELVVNFS